VDKFAQYLESCGFSQHTIRPTVNHVKAFLHWCTGEGVSAISMDYPKMLQFLAAEQQRGIQQQSILRSLYAVDRYYRYLMAEGLATENPTDSITLQGIPRRRVYPVLSMEELKQLYARFPTHSDACIDTRNKVFLGLILFQGVRAVQFDRLTVHDVRLRKAKVRIPGSVSSNERWLSLEPEQLLDLVLYRTEVRAQLLSQYGRETDKLFFTLHSKSDELHNLRQQVFRQLKRINRRLVNYHHLRASLLVHWLKEGNVRQAQYRAGHRYVSSTEAFRLNDAETLREEIDAFFPEL